jgi:hypothetical protein
VAKRHLPGPGGTIGMFQSKFQEYEFTQFRRENQRSWWIYPKKSAGFIVEQRAPVRSGEAGNLTGRRATIRNNNDRRTRKLRTTGSEDPL